MKIRMLVSIAGHAEPTYGLADFAFSPGDVVDVDNNLAAAWIQSGIAEKPSRKAVQVGGDAQDTAGESA